MDTDGHEHGMIKVDIDSRASCLPHPPGRTPACWQSAKGSYGERGGSYRGVVDGGRVRGHGAAPVDIEQDRVARENPDVGSMIARDGERLAEPVL